MARATKPAAHDGLPGQVVRVLQGGGALGACQWGVYEALHQRGIEPAWVIGIGLLVQRCVAHRLGAGAEAETGHGA